MKNTALSALSALSRTILLLSITGASFFAFGGGQPVQVVHDSTEFVSLNSSARFLVDTLHRSIEEIAEDTGFVEVKQPTPNFGFTRSTVWARCSILDSSNAQREWVIEAGIPSIHHVTCFVRNESGGFDSLQSGLLAPFSRRSRRSRKKCTFVSRAVLR